MRRVLRILALWFSLVGLVWLLATTKQDVFTLPLALGGTHIHTGFDSWLTLGLAMALIPALAMWLTITTVSIDREKATATTRLVGAPEWIVKNEVTAPEFWCLPLDGSQAWQFHRPSRTATR